MKEKIPWEKWEAFGLTFLLAAATFIWVPVSYAVNDDVGLEKILSGMYSGVPDGHAVYLQALLAYPLSWVYRLFPQWNWYGIFLCGLQWLCLALVFYRACGRIRDAACRRLALLCIMLVFLTAVWENYVSVTYTMTAGIVLSAALYWYLTGAGGIQTQVLTALLTLAGIALRAQFAPVILLIGGICWLLRARQEGIRNTWQLPALLGAGLLLMGCCQRAAYASGEWQEFLKWNEARTEVYDYAGVPSYEEDRDFYEEQKVGVQVFEALDIYDLTGRSEVTEELLRSAASYSYQKQRRQVSFWERAKQALKGTAGSLFSDAYGQAFFPVNLLAAVVWIGFLCMAAAKKKYFQMLLGMALLLAMGALWFYLAFRGRLLYRVLFTMHLMLLASGAGFISFGAGEWRPLSDHPLQKKLLMLLGLLLLLPALRTVPACREKALEAERQNQDREMLEDYFGEHPDQFFFVTTPLLAPVSGNISLFTKQDPMNYDELGGWTVKSPLYRERLLASGVQDVREALLSQKGRAVTSGRRMTYLFSDEYEEETEILYECTEELHGKAWKYFVYRYVLP